MPIPRNNAVERQQRINRRGARRAALHATRWITRTPHFLRPERRGVPNIRYRNYIGERPRAPARRRVGERVAHSIEHPMFRRYGRRYG